ncbi:MAG: helix-turn-helix transcriptional regulator [Clostridia bacterium]|nr:helix-turn-helix transcriptional regulator [Clostridia bacterium]
MGVFSGRLREVRVLRGITQEELAEMADIARTMIGRYETTDQLPALDTLVRIADALGTSTDYLLGRTDTLDAPFVPNYVAPPKPPRRMPRSAAELESFIREITTEILKDNDLLQD